MYKMREKYIFQIKLKPILFSLKYVELNIFIEICYYYILFIKLTWLMACLPSYYVYNIIYSPIASWYCSMTGWQGNAKTVI